MKDVTLITVQYNNAPDTRILLDSVGRLDDVSRCQIVVVDNSDAPSPVPDEGSTVGIEVRTIRPPKNLYYWGGAAFALESLFGPAGPWPKWVIVCNNDIEIADEDFLRKLNRLDSATHPIVAPQILSRSTGKDQNPILETRPTRMQRLKWRLYDLSYPIARSLLAIHAVGGSLRTSSRGKTSGSVSTSTEPRRVYAPHGACMIFSSAFFERGGELDTQVPLFAEELTIAALAESRGIPVWYCPDLRISHREHSTTGHGLTRAKYEMERMARRRYYEYGR